MNKQNGTKSLLHSKGPKTSIFFGVSHNKKHCRLNLRTLKVGIKKYRPFRLFVCFSWCHFTKPWFTEKSLHRSFVSEVFRGVHRRPTVMPCWAFTWSSNFNFSYPKKEGCCVLSILGSASWYIIRYGNKSRFRACLRDQIDHINWFHSTTIS